MTRRTWSSRHDHVFGQDKPVAGERRTVIVVMITAVTMVVEITAGLLYGSMALLADGLHMASHAVALGIAAFAYRYARRHAADAHFSFGTGKVNTLAGYSGAVLLGVFAVGMAAESIERFFNPVSIDINNALVVAVLGLVVNGASVLILGIKSHQGEHHHNGQADRHHDHNFRSAYLHVLADTLTSVLAIAALLAAKYFSLAWLDPMMGIVGAGLVAKWSFGLLRQSGRVLLDHQADKKVLSRIRDAIEADGEAEIVDLHVWTIGPSRLAAIISIETKSPKNLDTYRGLIQEEIRLDHLTVEVSALAPVSIANRSA